MKRELLYVIGEPGAGKSSLVRAALAGIFGTDTLHPIPHIVYEPGTCQLGFARPDFPGTDALPMNVQPKAQMFLHTATHMDFILGEGDRLGNGRFFEEAALAGFDPTIVFLDTPPHLAEARRNARGSRQNPTWVKGRQTKVRNLAKHYAEIVWRLDGGLDVVTLAMQLRTHPVIQAIRAERSKVTA